MKWTLEFHTFVYAVLCEIHRGLSCQTSHIAFLKESTFLFSLWFAFMTSVLISKMTYSSFLELYQLITCSSAIIKAWGMQMTPNFSFRYLSFSNKFSVFASLTKCVLVLALSFFPLSKVFLSSQFKFVNWMYFSNYGCSIKSSCLSFSRMTCVLSSYAIQVAYSLKQRG